MRVRPVRPLLLRNLSSRKSFNFSVARRGFSKRGFFLLSRDFNRLGGNKAQFAFHSRARKSLLIFSSSFNLASFEFAKISVRNEEISV